MTIKKYNLSHYYFIIFAICRIITVNDKKSTHMFEIQAKASKLAKVLTFFKTEFSKFYSNKEFIYLHTKHQTDDKL